MQKCVALTIIALMILPLAGADDRPPDESREEMGGHSILLEQYTATWCDTCATIDSWILDFIDDRSSRVVRVALHPLGPDPFGSNLTTHRVYLNGDSGDVSLPSFWFDGEGQLEGDVSQSTLENGLRDAEANREYSVSIHLWWDTWNNEPHDTIQEISIHIDGEIPENANITVFRLETLKMLDEIAYNGVDNHHDVATQMITFNPNGMISESFDGSHGWELSEGNRYDAGGVPVYNLQTYGDVDTFVAMIEVDGDIWGAIGISDDNGNDHSNKSSISALILLFCVLALSTALSRKG